MFNWHVQSGVESCRQSLLWETYGHFLEIHIETLLSVPRSFYSLGHRSWRRSLEKYVTGTTWLAPYVGKMNQLMSLSCTLIRYPSRPMEGGGLQYLNPEL